MRIHNYKVKREQEMKEGIHLTKSTGSKETMRYTDLRDKSEKEGMCKHKRPDEKCRTLAN